MGVGGVCPRGPVVVGCQDTLCLQNPGLCEGKRKLAPQVHFLQREECQSEHLVPSPVSQNADFIFAFYELERGNSFPWYNMTLWRKSCPNTFCSQILSWKGGRTEMK